MSRRFSAFAILTFALVLIVGTSCFAQDSTETNAEDATNIASETEAPSDTEDADEVNLANEQDEIAQKYKRLEELLFRMAEFEAQNNPRRAAVLREAFKQSKDRLTVAQMQAVVRALQRDLLKQAVDGQEQTKKNLESLLALLLTEDRETNVAGEKERIRQYIRDIEKALRTQRTLQGQNEGGGDADRIAKQQGDLAEKTGDLADRIKANEEGGNSASDNASSDPNGGEGSEGGESGEPSEGEQGEGEPGDNGDKEPGDEDGNDPQDKEPGDKEPEDKESGDKEPGDKEPGDKKPSDGNKPSEGGENGEGKPSEGESGEGEPSEGEPMEGSESPMSGQSGQSGQSGESGQQEQQPQSPESQARQRLEEAQQQMKQAQRDLEEARREESIQAQEEAKKKLIEAKAQLEEILRQLREEELERMLALLEGRFRRMLEMEIKVYEGTLGLAKIPEENRGREVEVESNRLSFSQKKIGLEADKVLTLLLEEGSSIAFPETVRQMREDMELVAERLGQAKIDRLTQGIEEDIIQTLEEMIEALQQAQQDLEEQQQQQQQQQQQMQQQEQPLVDMLQELRMIRSLQLRINKRTERFSRLLDDTEDVVGQAEDVDLIEALQKLADRQSQLQRITREIVNGKNK